MKDQLVFDVTDATSIAHSDSVGAFVRAGSDGDLIGSQNVNSQDWLNTASLLYDETGTAISDANPLAVSVKDGVNVEVDLSHVDDSVRLGDGTTLHTGTTVGGDHGLDVYLINTEIAVTQGSDSPWTVDATDLDIRDITHVSDSIRLGDGTSLITSTLEGGKQALDVYVANEVSVNDAALANTAIANAANTLGVADTAEDVVASPLTDRKYLFIRNMDNKQIYVGANGSTTAAAGFPLSPGSILELRAGASIDIEFVGSTAATPEIRTLELS